MIIVRRVAGTSMLPVLRQGQLIVAIKSNQYKAGDIVVFSHEGKEKIKRLSRLKKGSFEVLGDNSKASTDSREFGWLPLAALRAKLIWPQNKQ